MFTQRCSERKNTFFTPFPGQTVNKTLSRIYCIFGRPETFSTIALYFQIVMDHTIKISYHYLVGKVFVLLTF
jgi:hypothetical protein